MSLIDRFITFVTGPVPMRTRAARKILKVFPVGSFDVRLKAGAFPRPNYVWCMYQAAIEAKALGHKAFTVIELGVAGGNGLVCLCELRQKIKKEVGIEIIVVGFDSGEGLPKSTDNRDMLYAWPPGAYKMDRAALEARIAGRAELVLGNVSATVSQWNPRSDAPVGAIMFDLDYYTSTMDALPLLTKEKVLPRVWCYFDDVCAGSAEALTDYIGEREAIRQFNESPDRAKYNDHLSPAYSFKHIAPESWHRLIYLYHRLNHPDYNTCLVGSERDQLQLR